MCAPCTDDVGSTPAHMVEKLEMMDVDAGLEVAAGDQQNQL